MTSSCLRLCPHPFKRRNLEVFLVNSHCHVAVWAAVSESAPLLLKGDEVPNSHHGVFRHVEVEELHAGKGVVGVELARRPGEIVGYKQAIYGME